MPKYLNKNEIDLIDIFQVIWKEKLKVLFFILASLIIFFFSYNFKPQENIVIKAKTKISSISAYDEAEYNMYNSIISRIKPFNNIENTFSSEQNNNTSNNKVTMTYGKILENSKMYNIDKDFLISLFFDKLNDKSNLINLIKKSNFINKDDYPRLSDFENAVDALSSSIEIEYIKNEYSIISNIFDKKKYESFLKFLNTEINNQIQKDLSEMFIDNLNYIKRLKQFRIEDIDVALKITKNQIELDQLLKQKNILLANRYIERIAGIFEGSPISKPSEFYAAKINYNLTKYETNQTRRSYKSSLYVALTMGTLLGVFFVLIANAIRKRKQK